MENRELIERALRYQKQLIDIALFKDRLPDAEDCRKIADTLYELSQRLSASEDRWINVEDKLPKKSGLYLCRYDGIKKIKWFLPGIKKFCDAHIHNKAYEDYFNNSITEWRSLS